MPRHHLEAGFMTDVIYQFRLNNHLLKQVGFEIAD